MDRRSITGLLRTAFTVTTTITHTHAPLTATTALSGFPAASFWASAHGSTAAITVDADTMAGDMDIVAVSAVIMAITVDAASVVEKAFATDGVPAVEKDSTAVEASVAVADLTAAAFTAAEDSNAVAGPTAAAFTVAAVVDPVVAGEAASTVAAVVDLAAVADMAADTGNN
jgi:hypothetical protein